MLLICLDGSIWNWRKRWCDGRLGNFHFGSKFLLHFFEMWSKKAVIGGSNSHGICMVSTESKSSRIKTPLENSTLSWKLPLRFLDGHKVSCITFSDSKFEGVRSFGPVYFLCPTKLMILCLRINNFSKKVCWAFHRIAKYLHSAISFMHPDWAGEKSYNVLATRVL